MAAEEYNSFTDFAAHATRDHPTMTVLTGVGWHLSASHRDRLTGVVHGHSWEVIAWFDAPHENDAVMLQEHLKGVLKAFDHTILPDELARAEDFAAAIKHLMPAHCVEVEIRRPLERLHARAR